jgi:hypothetical protein
LGENGSEVRIVGSCLKGLATKEIVDEIEVKGANLVGTGGYAVSVVGKCVSI